VYIWSLNNRVKFRTKIPMHCCNINKSRRGGFFFGSPGIWCVLAVLRSGLTAIEIKWLLLLLLNFRPQSALRYTRVISADYARLWSAEGWRCNHSINTRLHRTDDVRRQYVLRHRLCSEERTAKIELDRCRHCDDVLRIIIVHIVSIWSRHHSSTLVEAVALTAVYKATSSSTVVVLAASAVVQQKTARTEERTCHSKVRLLLLNTQRWSDHFSLKVYRVIQNKTPSRKSREYFSTNFVRFFMTSLSVLHRAILTLFTLKWRKGNLQ